MTGDPIPRRALFAAGVGAAGAAGSAYAVEVGSGDGVDPVGALAGVAAGALGVGALRGPFGPSERGSGQPEPGR